MSAISAAGTVRSSARERARRMPANLLPRCSSQASGLTGSVSTVVPNPAPLSPMARLKSPLCQRRCGEDIDADRAGGFAENRDVVGIAAEGRDVALNPLQSSDLIEDAVIAGGFMRRFRGQ